MRGINRQSIFEDDEDNQKFIQTLQHYKEISGYALYAYCLMGNHVHLLLHVGIEPLEQIMRRICGSYVYWYNKKYERIGNLFQDRFKSEPVENNAYFLTVLRYIHQNPSKAGVVKDIEKYKWNSYAAYIKTDSLKLVDVDYALKIFHEDKTRAIKYFVDLHVEEDDTACLDIELTSRITDQEAREIIKTLCDIKSGYELQLMDREKRGIFLKQLKKEYNLSIRQIERLTGINRGIILKA